MSSQPDAADLLIEMINDTGGIKRVKGHGYTPVIFYDCHELAHIYLIACAEKCVFPVFATDSGEDDDGGENDDIDPL
jgi:hypothetical protein